MKSAITLFLLMLFSSLTLAVPPSIIGTWSGKTDLINREGAHETIEYQLNFTSMKGNYVTGVASWKAAEKKHYSVGKTLHNFSDEKFIGTYDKKSDSYYLVETTEHSLLKVDLLENGDMNVIYLEGGEHAVVFNGILKNKQTR